MNVSSQLKQNCYYRRFLSQRIDDTIFSGHYWVGKSHFPSVSTACSQNRLTPQSRIAYILPNHQQNCLCFRVAVGSGGWGGELRHRQRSTTSKTTTDVSTDGRWRHHNNKDDLFYGLTKSVCNLPKLQILRSWGSCFQLVPLSPRTVIAREKIRHARRTMCQSVGARRDDRKASKDFHSSSKFSILLYGGEWISVWFTVTAVNCHISRTKNCSGWKEKVGTSPHLSQSVPYHH